MLTFLASLFRSAPPQPVRLCKDCRWHEMVVFYPKCKHPKAGKVNLVTGESEYDYCTVQRMIEGSMAGRLRLCGKQARWFEPRA